MPGLLGMVYGLLARFYLPIWYRYPTTFITFRLRARQHFWRWVGIAAAAMPVYVSIMYLAGGAYNANGNVLLGAIGAIAGISYFKLMVIVPAAIIRHGVLTWREQRPSRRQPATT